MKVLIICLCGFFVQSVSSQNLIRNAGFEHHLEFPHGLSPFKWGAINYLTDWWWTGSTVIDLCDTLLENRTDKLFKPTSCCGNTIDPRTGKGMVKLYYGESCGIVVPTPGCASYIKTKLISPLIVGEVYRISMWVYFHADQGEDPSIYKNIGFYLSLHPQTIETPNLFDLDYFFADSVHLNEWYEIKHYVRALCPLQHITIGVFRNSDFPKLHRNIENPAIYFIDDVSVIKIEEDTVHGNIEPTPFCNYFERKKKEEDVVKVEEINLYFPTNEFVLREQHKKSLDNFYKSKEANKGRAFVVTGHTDDEGNDNKRLSLDRAHAVRDYLKSTYNIEDHLIICYGKGVDTTGNNTTEKGKQLNRRVTLQNSNITSLQALYRKGLDYVKRDQIPEAARTFKEWINLAPRDQKMQILHDPRLALMKELPVWKFLRDEVKKDYKFYSQSWNAFFLDSLYFVDQRYRTFTPSYLSAFVLGVDTFAFSKKEIELTTAELIEFDSQTYSTLKKYLTTHPYPKISHVGRRQAKAASYIIAHQLDSTVLQKFLPIVEEYCLQGEAEWEFYAIMYDKLQVLKGQPQHYGTQYTARDKQVTGLYKVDDIEKVNIRRRHIGLSPVVQHYYP